MIPEWIENLWYTIKYQVIDKFFAKLGYQPILLEPDTSGMWVYDEANPVYVTITKIIVPSEEDKLQLLLGSAYLHDLRNIDTDLQAVNTIVHLYQRPELIEVDSNK